jgi:FkbM family methyltransferase
MEDDGNALIPRVSLDDDVLPGMTCYAQNFEDVMIRRALQEIQGGFYIDIGAFDSAADSVTRWFYDNGWRGVNVEPSPALYDKLVRERPEDENLRCAVASHAGRLLLNVVGETGLSTTSDTHAAAASAAGYAVTARVEVPACTLDEILDRYGGKRTIDFLKIDAEGSEAEILNASRFSAGLPRLVIVEAVQLLTHQPAWEAWEPGLLGRGYHFAWFDGLNRFYVRDEDRWRLQFFGIPPCVLDNFTPHYHAAALAQVAELKARLQAGGARQPGERWYAFLRRRIRPG